MIHHTTLLLRSIWEISSARQKLLTTFERWVQDGASRKDVKERLNVLIASWRPEGTGQQGGDDPAIDLEQINWAQLTEFLCHCFYRRRLHRPLPDVPSDELWEKLSGELYGGPLSAHPYQEKAIKETVPVPLVSLEQRLLAVGGIRVVYQDEPDLQSLLKRGEVFDDAVALLPGEPHYCHANAARFWHEKQDELAIVTGYALSEDGLWRQHSWLLHRDPVTGKRYLLETTTRRTKYLGFILTKREARMFYEMNALE